MGISVLTLGKFQKNQDKLVTLNLGHAGFEESVDSAFFFFFDSHLFLMPL